MSIPSPTEPESPKTPVPLPAQKPIPKLPLVALGLMSVFSLVGPFVIFMVLRGGKAEGWPPDRPIEWWTIGAISGLVVVLLITCVTNGLWSPPNSRPKQT